MNADPYQHARLALAAYHPAPPVRDWRSARVVALAVVAVLSPVALHFALMLLGGR